MARPPQRLAAPLRVALLAGALHAGTILSAAPPLAQAGPPPAPAAALPELVQAFQAPELPEGLAVEAGGATYVGIASRGTVLRFAPDGTRTVLATLRPGLGSLLGLAVDGRGNVLAALASQNSPGSDAHGLWRIAPDGSTVLVAPLPGYTMPNGIAVAPDGNAYVTDSMRGAIWRVAPDGTATRWAQSELLEGDLTACPPPGLTGPVGANGVVIDPGRGLLVANTTKAQIVRVPIATDGGAGPAEVLYGPDCVSLAGADGLALDGAGRLHATLNWQNRLIRIDPAGETTVLAVRADGLDFPASVATDGDRLYLTNYALLTFLRDEGPRPSLMTIGGN